MPESTTIPPELIERSADIVRDAFNRGFKTGYDAAIAAVMRVAQAGAPVDDSDHQATHFTASLHDEVKTTDSFHVTASGRAAPGSIKNLVRAFVLSANRPVTEAEFAAQYPDVGRPSRYMAFRTLGNEGVIIKRDGQWFPASADAGKPDVPASGPETPQGNGGNRD